MEPGRAMSDPQSIKEPAATYSTVADSARLKYQTALRHFEAKYPQGFAALREAVTHEQADAEQEQDYFDWELAVSSVEADQALNRTFCGGSQ